MTIATMRIKKYVYKDTVRDVNHATQTAKRTDARIPGISVGKIYVVLLLVDYAPMMKSVLKEYVFLRNLHSQILLVVKINAKMLTMYVRMVNAETSARCTIYVLANRTQIALDINTVILALVDFHRNVLRTTIALKEWFVISNTANLKNVLRMRIVIARFQ